VELDEASVGAADGVVALKPGETISTADDGTGVSVRESWDMELDEASVGAADGVVALKPGETISTADDGTGVSVRESWDVELDEVSVGAADVVADVILDRPIYARVPLHSAGAD